MNTIGSIFCIGHELQMNIWFAIMRRTSSRTLGVTTTWTGFEMVPPRIFHSRYSRRMTRSDHCRVCSSSFRLGFPFSPRGVSGLPSWEGHTIAIADKLLDRLILVNLGTAEDESRETKAVPCRGRRQIGRPRIQARATSRVSPSTGECRAPDASCLSSSGRGWRDRQSV